jgi:cytosine/adenosine deaminase-related metal-dependent hydrolase
MDEWIRRLLAVRRIGPAGGQPAAEAAMREAVRSMVAAGTVLVGDISNTLGSIPFLAEAGLGGVVFYELLGFNAVGPAAIVKDANARLDALRQDVALPPEAAPIRTRVVAHAPYSVSPALFAEIARSAAVEPLSVHLGESPEEIQFLRTGEGPIRRMLEAMGVWIDTWPIPACDPVEYMHRVGYLQPGLLAVHATQLGDDALERLAAAGAVVVTCPRSNAWVGAGLPRIAHFYSSGVPVAIGTDSLASVGTLSLFDELAELRRIAPDVAAASLLESATRVGAEALGFGRTHGTIGPGKAAALIAVDVPPDVTDVEEYLVSGVAPDAVHPLP